QIIKIVGAVLLAIAFFLPLSRCAPVTLTPNEDGELVAEAPEVETVYEYYYAYDNIGVEEPGSFLLLVVFFWPLAFLAFERKGRNTRAKTALMFLGPPLAAGTGYLIIFISIFNELYYGTYVALAGLAGYFIGSGIEAGCEIKAFMEKRRQ
ncbi:MAG: hypothetical protein ACTSU8_06315, partial [Alphaproteobacteria bacterium]